MSKAKKRISAEEGESDDGSESDSNQPRSASKKKLQMSEEADVPAPSLSRKPLSFEYGNIHRAVLQYLMSVTFVEEEKLERITTTLGRPAKLSLSKLVQEINAMLTNEDLHMQIRLRQMVEDPERPKVYGIVSTRSDSITKQTTSLEPWKLVLFNVCLQQLAKSENATASETEIFHAYNETPNKQNKSLSEVSQTLSKLAADGWLRETKKNVYTAGPRTMLELSEVLREYGAGECPISKQTVLPTVDYKKWLSENGH